MKQAEKKTIDVLLTVLEETDVLIFGLDDDNPEKFIVNLNSSSGQIEIKEVFSKLLELLVERDIDLELKIAEDYSKGLYKDVCAEYIKDLNREILQVRSAIEQSLM